MHKNAEISSRIPTLQPVPGSILVYHFKNIPILAECIGSYKKRKIVRAPQWLQIYFAIYSVCEN